MSSSKSLVMVLGLALSAAAGAEPVATGGASGSTKTAAKTASTVIPTETLVVGGAALVGTVAGLSSDSDGGSTTSSLSNSTPTSSAP